MKKLSLALLLLIMAAGTLMACNKAYTILNNKTDNKSGQVYHFDYENTKAGKNRILLDVTGIATGNYHCEIMSVDKISVGEFSITK